MRRQTPPCRKACCALLFSFLEVISMYEERELLARGYPLEDAITMCNSMRRTGELDEFIVNTCKKPHVCTCGGKGNCPDCPNLAR